jgi:thiamine kinase-like enzyme
MNLLLDTTDYNRVYMIDFELTGLNCRGWDLAYHFFFTTFNMRSGADVYQMHFDMLSNNAEIEEYLKIYLNRFHDKHYSKFEGEKLSLEAFVEMELPRLMDQFKRCLMYFLGFFSMNFRAITPLHSIAPHAFG